MTPERDTEIRAIFDEIVAHTPDLGPTPTHQRRIPTVDQPSRRRWASIAAASIMLAGAGGLAAVAWREAEPPTANRGSSPSSASSSPAPLVATPAEPTLFPVLDDSPAGLSITASAQRVGAEPLWTEALLGRLVDGVLTDTVTITVQSRPFDISPMPGKPPTEAEVLGETAAVFDFGTTTGQPVVHVTWGTGPYFLATGAAPLAFLGRVTDDAFHVTDAADTDTPPELSFGALPDGFDVIAAPQTIGRERLSATLSIGADNYDISVGTRNWLVAMAQVGPLRRVEVAGQPGWTFLSSFPTQDITWQADDATWVYLKINDGTDSAGALELADQITFVDWDTWVARYDPDVHDTAGSTEPADDETQAQTEPAS